MLRWEAARWFARLQHDGEPGVERKFRRWYERDPSHSAAFERISQSYEQAGLLRQSRAIGRHHAPASQQRPRLQRHALAAAASLALIVCGGAALLGATRLFGSTDVLMLATRVGEIRNVKLSDGSNVTLDSATSLAVEIGHSRRRARLDHGRARFSVTKASAPFVIDTGTASVTTSEGLLDVDRTAGDGHVAVLAGRADVRGAGARGMLALTLRAGQGFSIELGRLDSERLLPGKMDWTSGMLEFDGTPLADAAALANRYSARQVIVDPQAGRLRVTGAFRAGDTAGLAKALAAAFHLSLVRTPKGDFLLSPAAPPTPPK
jgi:transmembrane sensor